MPLTSLVTLHWPQSSMSASPVWKAKHKHRAVSQVLDRWEESFHWLAKLLQLLQPNYEWPPLLQASFTSTTRFLSQKVFQDSQFPIVLMHEITPLQIYEFPLSFVKLYAVPLIPFLQSVIVSLNDPPVQKRLSFNLESVETQLTAFCPIIQFIITVLNSFQHQSL